MDFNWKSKILEAARFVKSKKKRPSKNTIYETINNENEYVDINEFTDELNKLLSNGIIGNIKPNEEQGSYHICDEKISDVRNENDRINFTMEHNQDDGQIDDAELTTIIKNMIIEAKLNDANTITHLKEEICFLMRENDSKNNIIITLLEMIQHDKKCFNINQSV